MYAVAAAGAIAAVAGVSMMGNTNQPATVWEEPDASTYSKYNKGQTVYVTTPDGKLPIRKSQTGVASEDNKTLVGVLADIVAKKGDLPALRVERGGEWQTITWSQYLADIRRFGKSLISIGFKPFQAVSIIGFNSPEWFISLVGTMAAAGKGAGVYTTNSAEACQYVIDHSESAVVVVEDSKQLDKVLKVRDQLPHLKAIVIYAEEVPAKAKENGKCPVYSWKEFLEKGESVAEAELDARINMVEPSHACSLIYTSGTTGNPKAVMISHDNVMFEVRSVLSLLPWVGQTEDERGVSYLPLSHVAAQVSDIFLPIAAAYLFPKNCTISFARPDALKGTLPKTLQAVRPTLFLGVPRVWEKMVEGMKAKGKETKGIKKSLAAWAKGVGLKKAEAIQVGGSGQVPKVHKIADKLVFSKVRQALGLDACKFCFTGAAPISKETLSFLGSLGIHVYEVYGMSESCGATTWSTPETHRWGSAGFAMPGTELKLDHVDSRDKPGEGEICFRGRHIMMGYLKNEEKTKEAIDADGWLHSGDVGRIENGMLFITGRIKELIITAGGENIAPVPIEDEIKRLLPGVSNVMMVGDRRKYNTVLVTLTQKANLDTGAFEDELVGDALNVVPGVTTASAARNDIAWKAYIEKGIKEYNNGPICVSNAQKIQKFAILPTDFSIPGDELTGTLKVKRNVVATKYADIIEGFYADDAN